MSYGRFLKKHSLSVKPHAFSAISNQGKKPIDQNGCRLQIICQLHKQSSAVFCYKETYSEPRVCKAATWWIFVTDSLSRVHLTENWEEMQFQSHSAPLQNLSPSEYTSNKWQCGGRRVCIASKHKNLLFGGWCWFRELIFYRHTVRQILMWRQGHRHTSGANQPVFKSAMAWIVGRREKRSKRFNYCSRFVPHITSAIWVTTSLHHFQTSFKRCAHNTLEYQILQLAMKWASCIINNGHSLLWHAANA